MHSPSCIDLLNQWRRQITWRRKRGRVPRGIGALGWLVDGQVTGDLVELERMLFVVVYDEQRLPGPMAIRLGTYRASRIEHGVQFGGAANARLHKDILLSPQPGGGRLRLDLFNAAILDLALRLNSRIDVALRHQPRVARRGLRLPRLWAGFSVEVAEHLTGGGPEFEALCDRFGAAPELMLRKFRRDRDGLALFPLEWVSHRLGDSSRVFAEVVGFPKRQAFGVADPVTDLMGYEGAAAFDFFSNPYRLPAASGRRVA